MAFRHSSAVARFESRQPGVGFLGREVQAGALLRIAQPRVSDLARGRLGKFSMEKLLQFARLAGIDVEIRMKASSNPGLKVRIKAA